jgi:hypothetical protein
MTETREIVARFGLEVHMSGDGDTYSLVLQVARLFGETVGQLLGNGTSNATAKQIEVVLHDAVVRGIAGPKVEAAALLEVGPRTVYNWTEAARQLCEDQAGNNDPTAREKALRWEILTVLGSMTRRGGASLRQLYTHPQLIREPRDDESAEAYDRYVRAKEARIRRIVAQLVEHEKVVEVRRGRDGPRYYASSFEIPVDDPTGTEAALRTFLEICHDSFTASLEHKQWGATNGAATRYWDMNVWDHPVSQQLVDTVCQTLSEFEAKMNEVFARAQQHKPYRESEVQPIGALRLALGRDKIPSLSPGGRDEGRENSGEDHGGDAL